MTATLPAVPHATFPGAGDVPQRTITLEALRARLVDLLADLDALIADEKRRQEKPE